MAPAFLGRSATGDWELFGTRCSQCGETLFGRADPACLRCGAADLAEVGLGGRGTLWSFTVLRNCAPGKRRITQLEPLPRPIGLVEMDGHEVRILAPVDVEVERLRVGLPLRLVATELFTGDDGAPVVGYGFEEVDQ